MVESEGFHNDVRRLLAERGLSMAAASLKVGPRSAAISELLAGGTYPSPERLGRLAAALGAPPSLAGAWLAERRTVRGHEGIGKPRTGRERACPVCREKVYVPKLREGAWRACSRACAAKPRTKSRGGNLLQRRCLEWLAEHRASRAELAKRIGANSWLLQYWLRKGQTPSSQLVIGLAELFGLPPAQALEEAGGETTEDVQRRKAEALAAYKYKKGHVMGPDVRTKIANAQRGKKRSEITRARMSAGMLASPKLQENVERVTSASRSNRGRAAHLLFGRLRHEPSPSRELIRSWAEESAPKLKLTATAILHEWKRHLLKRGLWTWGGRPPKKHETRCPFMCRLLILTPRGAAGRRPKTFWGQAELKLADAEGPEAPAAKDLKDWCLDDASRGCQQMAAALATTIPDRTVKPPREAS